MPVVIKELEIKTHIMGSEEDNLYSSGGDILDDDEDDILDDEDYIIGNRYPSNSTGEIDGIIEECTERVLEILKRKNEW